MFADEAIKLLNKLREDITASKDYGGNDFENSQNYNEGIEAALSVVSKEIRYYSQSPAALKHQ